MKYKQILPLYIFSLPRSGSTLLQKILTSHSKIASISEPWFLLPLAYSLKKEGIKTEYGHETAVAAIKNALNHLPRGHNEYYQSIRDIILNLYSKLSSPDSLYFLDKTPRYFHIIPFINNLFPEGKFIFLVRNPISIISSYIETINNNSIKRFDNFDRDLYHGTELLANGYIQLKDKSIVVKYEDFVVDPGRILKGIFDYLDLDFDRRVESTFHDVDLRGQLGDQFNARVISDRSENWKEIVVTSTRKKILEEYINKVSDKYLSLGNYNRHELLKALYSYESTFSCKDFYYYYEFKTVYLMKKIIKWNSYS